MKKKRSSGVQGVAGVQNGNPFGALTAAFGTPELLQLLNSSLLYDHLTP
jgi:hypothetical protein